MDFTAAPMCHRVRTLQRYAADLISSLSAAVRARNRVHVSRQCETGGKNKVEEIREGSAAVSRDPIDHSAIPPRRNQAEFRTFLTEPDEFGATCALMYNERDGAGQN